MNFTNDANHNTDGLFNIKGAINDSILIAKSIFFISSNQFSPIFKIDKASNSL